MKIILLSLLMLGMIGCGSDDSKEEDGPENLICELPRKTHKGCCSSHGGFSGNCESNKFLYGEISEKLVCSDGTFSPTCIY